MHIKESFSASPQLALYFSLLIAEQITRANMPTNLFPHNQLASFPLVVNCLIECQPTKSEGTKKRESLTTYICRNSALALCRIASSLCVRKPVQNSVVEDDIGVDLIGSQDHLEGVGLWSTHNIVILLFIVVTISAN